MMADPTVISLRPGGAVGLRAPKFLTPRLDSSSSSEALGSAAAFKVPHNLTYTFTLNECNCLLIYVFACSTDLQVSLNLSLVLCCRFRSLSLLISKILLYLFSSWIPFGVFEF